MDKKILKLSLTPEQVQVKEALNKDFLHVTIRAISDVNPNRNNSHFVLTGMQKAVDNGNFYNRPILANFVPENNDFGGHDGQIRYDPELDQLYEDFTNPNCETPIGSIRESDKVEIIFDEAQGVHWIVFDAIIWTRYSYKAVKKILKSKKGKNKISVEVEVLDSVIREDGVEDILEFNYLGTTLLGDKLTTGIQDAELTIWDKIESALFQKKQKVLSYAYNAYDNTVENTDDNQDSNIQEYSSGSENIDNETPVEEISMNNQEFQEGGNSKMLTMNMKRELLQAYLNENYKWDESDNDCCHYLWVCDLSDVDVYFDVDDVTYRASYTISENEEGHYVATVDLDSKVQCVRSWVDFAENNGNDENGEDNNGDGKTVETKVETEDATCDVCGKNPCECSTKETESATGTDVPEDTETEPEKQTQAAEENVEDECNKFEANGEVDLTKEPNPVNTDGMTMPEIIERSTQSIVAPEVQTEAGSLGEAAAQVTMPADAPSGETHIVNDNDGGGSTAVSVGPDGEKAEVVTDNTPVATVKQPDDNDKEKMFSAENPVVEIDGESYDFNSLYTKYTELKEQFNALSEKVEARKLKDLIEYAANFINSDKKVDDETKKDYIAQATEKINAFELEDNESVLKFTKSLIGMYYYEKAQSTDNSKDFSAPIHEATYENHIIPANDDSLATKIKNLKKLNK